MPTQIQFGRGGLKTLGKTAATLGGRAMLVGYADRTGLESAYDRAAKSLTRAGLSVSEFFEVPPDPNGELAVEGARRATEAAIDVLVGLGGGSAIDTAKGIGAMARMGGELWDYAGTNPNFTPVTDSIPLIAVPTTAGTGSELTAVAVFNHHGLGSLPGIPLKASISGPAVLPKVALVDPDLTVGSPAALTAACGADALGHAIEACMSRRANPIASSLGGRAVGLIVEHLRRAVEEPDDAETREFLSLASTLAGAAFASAGVIMTHSMAHALGAILHIPHGTAIAAATPTVLRYNLDQCTETYGMLAHYCGIAVDSPKEQAERFVDRITELLESVGLAGRIQVPNDAPDDLAAKLATNAFESTLKPLEWTPREIDEPTLKKLFEGILTT